MSGFKGEEDIQFTSVWSSGVKTDDYVVAGITFKTSSPEYPNDVMVLDPTQALGAPRFDKTEFPEFEWVDVKYYVSTANVDGHDCYQYQRTPAQMQLPDDGTVLTVAQAKAKADTLAKLPPENLWIDTKTGLPIKYDSGYGVSNYTYTADPKRTLSPSPVFEELIKAYAHRMPR